MDRKVLIKREDPVMERAWVRRILDNAARLPDLWPFATGLMSREKVLDRVS